MSDYSVDTDVLREKGSQLGNLADQYGIAYKAILAKVNSMDSVWRGIETMEIKSLFANLQPTLISIEEQFKAAGSDLIRIAQKYDAAEEEVTNNVSCGLGL